jgi:leader peptidase (prepilin peptidase)/N-methyltransferase
MGVAIVLVAAVAGALTGGYLPGVVARVPAGQPALVRGWEPRRVWASSRGLPLVACTATVFALLAARFGAAPVLPAYLYLGAVGVALAFIDLACHRLPDALTLPSYPIALGLLALAALPDGDWPALLRALSAMVVLFGTYFLLAAIYPAGMGFGDVKLSGLLGLYLGWLGWEPVLIGTFLAFLTSAVVGLGLVIARRATLKSRLPFGPFMLLGALLAVLLS